MSATCENDRLKFELVRISHIRFAINATTAGELTFLRLDQFTERRCVLSRNSLCDFESQMLVYKKCLVFNFAAMHAWLVINCGDF